jgi:hypothetical protein
MTAPIRLDHFAHLKQPASDYLFQIYQLSCELQDLKEALEKLLDIIRKSLKSSHDCHDRGDIPFMEFIELDLSELTGISLLREAVSKMESRKGFETYLDIYNKVIRGSMR